MASKSAVDLERPHIGLGRAADAADGDTGGYTLVAAKGAAPPLPPRQQAEDQLQAVGGAVSNETIRPRLLGEPTAT